MGIFQPKKRKKIGPVTKGVLASILVHLLIANWLGSVEPPLRSRGDKDPVKIRVVPKNQLADLQKKNKPKGVIETPLKKTQPPDPMEDFYLGNQNHRAKQQRKLAKPNLNSALDPGSGKQGAPKATSSDRTPTAKQPKPGAGQIYSQLLPNGKELARVMREGYQDFIDEEMATGDVIDVNTIDSSWLPYFTSLRKAIDLAGLVPLSALRNYRLRAGSVITAVMLITIRKDGELERAEITGSSGYPLIDQALVDLVQRSAPFSPLPRFYKKKRVTFSGEFRLML